MREPVRDVSDSVQTSRPTVAPPADQESSGFTAPLPDFSDKYINSIYFYCYQMNPTRRKFIGTVTGTTLLGSGGCLGVLDGETSSDGETSPTETAKAVEQFRVVVEYSGTWRGDIQYFDGETLVRVPFAALYDDPDRMLNPSAVVQTIETRGTPARTFESVDDMLPSLVDTLRPGDVALLMSNGSFDGLHERLLTALRNDAPE